MYGTEGDHKDNISCSSILLLFLAGRHGLDG